MISEEIKDFKTDTKIIYTENMNYKLAQRQIIQHQSIVLKVENLMYISVE